MSSVTDRIKQIKQPWGGYLKPSTFDQIVCQDGLILNETENISASIVGMAVDYLSRCFVHGRRDQAFSISLEGAEIAEELGKKGSEKAAAKLLRHIKRLDEKSIISACKLVSFDLWKRNTIAAMMSDSTYEDINPDQATIENIQIMVRRGVSFFKTYGPILTEGFTFDPPGGTEKQYAKMIKTGKGSFGGYTPTVDSGDGDFLTENTIWDFKVSNAKPTSKHTLQLLMYWIMGQHSGQDIYKGITKLGIFNPRLNTVFLMDIEKIPQETIETIEREVICYK